jgi:hypothetical protein
MDNPRLLFFADKTGAWHTTLHEGYDHDIAFDDVQGMKEHCEKCPSCAERYKELIQP